MSSSSRIAAFLMNGFVLFLLGAGSLWAASTLAEPLPEGECVIVSVDGEESRRIDLNQEGDYVISGLIGPVRLRVENGAVKAVESTCPRRLCMAMGPIPSGGSVIVCVPNRLSIRLDRSGVEKNPGGVHAVVR